MIKRFIARLLLLVFFWLFIWDEDSRSKWWKWFKLGGF